MVTAGKDSGVGVTFTVSGDDYSGRVIADYSYLGKEKRSKYSPISIFHGLLSSESPGEPSPSA